jgi:hypothetical protein
LLPKWQCSIEEDFGSCGGRLTLDWVHLCKFSSNFLDNWSVGNSLIVTDCLALTVDGGGTVIVFEMLMFDRCVFWEVCGRARA